ncbi:sugar phosphorylase [Listeria fleischmannii]|uniref:sugar phosphorylase n=1 Tax=Listeria fleischmannii TaxID=1069827 RepID=UPI0016291AA9|nr:sugar phosphorylase [Listeria fleischmannii]MBC1417985.1 sugar phosphorylase [Listeria fleischmannii]
MIDLKERLSRIYGADVACELGKRIETRILETKKKALYSKAEWDEKDVVLITYGDQFYKEDEKTLATFQMFFDKYLKNAFELVHILPFYPYSSDDGFSVIDYKEVNPKLGDWREIKALANSTRLMFDFVCNHISKESHWFKEYLAGNPEYEAFFIDLPADTDLSQVTRPRATPLLTPFSKKDGSNVNIWTTFSDDQIDLNFENPEVLYQMVDVLLFYLEEGASYVRLDAVGFMWKEPGTTSIHLPKTHEIIKLFRQIVDMAKPGTVLITETNVPHRDNISYFGHNDEAQMVYQFPLPPLVLHAIKNGRASILSDWASKIETPFKQTTYFNFLASHDGIGLNPIRGIVPEDEILSLVHLLEEEGALVSYKENPDGTKSPYEVNVTYMDALNQKSDEDDLRLKRFLVAHSILFTIPGVPAVYVQSVLGSRNDYEGVEKTQHNRSINRKKYEYDVITSELAEETSLRHKTFDALTKLIQFRKNEPLFHPDVKMDVLDGGEALFVMKRVNSEEELIVLHNLTNEPAHFDIEEGSYMDILSGKSYRGSGTLKLDPYAFYWLKQTKEEQ